MDRAAEVVSSLVGLRSTQIWPISQESAPLLFGLWLILATSLYLAFIREGPNFAHDVFIKERRKKKMKAFANLILLEEIRLRKLAGGSNNSDNSNENDCDECITSDEPATAKYIYDILFEKVEEEPACMVLAIEPADPWHLRTMAFFKHRVQSELDEAAKMTREARLLPHENQTEKFNFEEYQDGTKLAEALEFTREKALRHCKHLAAALSPAGMGPIDGVDLTHFDAAYLETNNNNETELCVVTMESVTEAEAVLREVRSAHRNALYFIFDIAKPVLPTYCLALLFMLAARAFEAPLWAYSFPSYKASVAMINSNATEGEYGYGPDILRTAHGHAIFFVVGFLFSRPIEMIAESLGNKAARDFSLPLRRAVMSAILKQDTEYFDVNPSSQLQERLNRDTDELVENMLWVPRRIAEFTFRVLQRTFTLYFVAPSMMWACLSFNVPLFTLLILATGAPLRRLLGKRDRSSERSTAETLEILQNVKTVRQFSMEGSEEAKYSLGNLSKGIFESRIRVLESVTHQLRFVGHIAGEMYVIYVAASLAMHGEATTTDAVIASTVGMWLQHDMKNLMEQVPKLFKIMKPFYRVTSLLACKPRIEQDPALEGPVKLHRPTSFQGHIQFKNVVFSYPTEKQKTILNGLSFTAEPGQKVAFVGKAGCGKSTAMDLLQRFYNRNSGEIRIDGHLIEEYDTNHLRKSCGVVAQTNVLFRRSIYENIVYGMVDPPGSESAQFMEVCRKARVWEFVRKFPNKQHTIVGETGVQLSGGQKQRIAIARVIMRKPTFLFLDEATSALDAINEKAVQQALDDMLKEFQGVAIVVAHRLTTICNCEKIVVMGDNGTEVEVGTHEELLKVPKQVDKNGDPVAGPGLYHTLWDTQQVKPDGNLKKQLDVSSQKIRQLKGEIVRLKRRASASKCWPAPLYKPNIASDAASLMPPLMPPMLRLIRTASEP